MSSRTLYLARDRYGEVLSATFDRERHETWKSEHTYDHSGKRDVKTYRQLVRALMKSGMREELFDAAWRRALQDPQFGISPRPALFELHEVLDEAATDAQSVEFVVGVLVNDPRSKFCIYG